MCGVKGPSWLSTIPYYDQINGMSVDYMHCVLLGVCRLTLRLWLQFVVHWKAFTCTWCSPLWNQTSKWNSANSMKFREYTKVLGQFTVFVQYVCRICWQSLYISIIAHELRAWLLHYSPVVLHGVLPESYYNHHILLVEGVYLLLKDIESEEDIDQSSRLLRHYCFLFAPLYGR